MILQVYSIGGRTGYFRSVRYMKDPLLRQFWPRRIFVLSQVLPKREDIAILARISRHLVMRHNRGWVITKKKVPKREQYNTFQSECIVPTPL